MALPVNSWAVVDEMGMAGDEITAYINRKTGELISLTAEEISYAEDDGSGDLEWLREAAGRAKQVLADQDYIELPNQYEIDEYAIMERFCYSVADERVPNFLLRALSGKGAFRCFKDRIIETGARENWFAFRNEALEKIAAGFFERRGIAFIDE